MEPVRAGDSALFLGAGSEESAFEQEIRPLLDAAYRLAAAILRDREEARDAVQEATLKAWRRSDQRRPGTLLRPWYLAIVANQAKSMRRGRWRSVLKAATVLGREQRASEAISPERMDLDEGLRHLGADDRAVLLLYYFLDLPVQEVADTLRISLPAAKSRIHRAIAKLRLNLDAGELQ